MRSAVRLACVVLIVAAVTAGAFANEPLRAFRSADATAVKSQPLPPGLTTADAVLTVAEALYEAGPGANSAPRGALLVGRTRKLERPVTIQDGVAAMNAATWRGAVHVPGADRTRLRLTVGEQRAAEMWVYSRDGGEWAYFDTRLAHDGELWTPSVDGDSIVLEVRGDARGIVITSAAAIKEPAPAGTECLRDAACDGASVDFRKAIGQFNYISGGDAYVCTGGLLNNDGGPEGDPLFLTANHCIATAAEAATVDVAWDYHATTCGGAPPQRSTRPRSMGATLLTTSPATDVTLLRLKSLPSGRVFLGWDPRPPSAGTALFRLSHPGGGPLHFSTSRVVGAGGTCTGWSRPDFVYASRDIGATQGGSSGAPVMYDATEGYVVGQLAGKCGTDLSDACSLLNSQVDGSFAQSYSVLQPFLRPGAPTTPPPCSPCSPNANTACMLDGRFKTTLTWTDPYASVQGSGRVITLAGVGSDQTFWSMYPQAPNNIEVVVRMVDGRGANGKFWTSAAGFAVAGYTVTIQDTQTCATWTRTVAPGSSEIVKDANALPGN